MKNTKRALRRHHTKRIQKKRINLFQKIFYGNDVMTERVKGSYKKENGSCNCGMCKPWKKKLDKKYTFSERKKLYGLELHGI